ncbi:helix-turn-helix transcriptional regulator [Pedobacter sp. ASV1-7]|uniref:helix-turn-helix domain-containing protein n=1 Tax=Pedobacter sp. ASV1-7 TaxID=3145237 RepID=UPI0032E90BC8
MPRWLCLAQRFLFFIFSDFFFLPMLLFNSEMHLVTFVFVILELMMLSVQLYFYLIWPADRRRLMYLILLVLLILYNVVGGIFPDPGMGWPSVVVQHIVAYGVGFLMGAYFPYYFYVSFELRSLRFHALYGTVIFLLLPYVVFFVLLYPLLGDLDFAIRYGLIVPGLYAPVLLYAMFSAIRLRFSCVQGECEADPYTRVEMLAVYWAVFPWGLMPLLAYFGVEQWVEALFANMGFSVIAVLFLCQSARYERKQRRRREERDAMEEKLQADFNQTCLEMGLSVREAEVALLLCQGLEYRVIGDLLHISSRTVDTHAHRIYYKLEVRNKIELQQVLGFSN